MRCEDVERLLDDRADGLLSEEDARSLEEHLRSCGDCREAKAAFATVGADVRSMVDALPVRPEFTLEVMVGVRGDEVRSRRRGLAFIGAGLLAAAAAALLLAAFLRTPVTVRVVGTEGGLLRLAPGAARWRALGGGSRLEPGAWVLTFPDRRARFDLAGTGLLIEGDVLAGIAPERIDLLHGRILVEAGERPCRVVAPFGGVEVARATVAVTLRYGREPVFRVGPEGEPTRVRSLLTLASVSLPDGYADIHLPAGHVEITALKGEAAWWAGERRGRLRAGETIRIGPEPAEPATVAEDLGDWITRPLGPVSETDMMLVEAVDPLEVMIEGLADSSPLTRRDSADRLGRLCGGARAVAAVADRLVVEEDALVVRALLDALRRLDAGERSGAVKEYLSDARPEVRETALRCWLDLRGREGIPEVGRMIDDPERDLRLLALRGLRALADPAARPWAEKALEDPDPAVVSEALRLLQALDR